MKIIIFITLSQVVMLVSISDRLYCIMRSYTECRLDRYLLGIPRELSEIRTQPWLREGSLPCDPCHHRGPIF